MSKPATLHKDFTEAIAELDRQTDAQAQQWFLEKKKIGVLGAIGSSLSQFYKSYVTEKKHREGVEGLFSAVNAGMYPFLSFAKYWELQKASKQAGES